MRTTLIIDDRLLNAAKREAASRGVTLSALVDHALREALRAKATPSVERFEMLTYGPRGKQAAHEPADFADAQSAEDRDRLDR